MSMLLNWARPDTHFVHTRRVLKSITNCLTRTVIAHPTTVYNTQKFLCSSVMKLCICAPHNIFLSTGIFSCFTKKIIVFSNQVVASISIFIRLNNHILDSDFVFITLINRFFITSIVVVGNSSMDCRPVLEVVFPSYLSASNSSSTGLLLFVFVVGCVDLRSSTYLNDGYSCTA